MLLPYRFARDHADGALAIEMADGDNLCEQRGRQIWTRAGGADE
jgi:hypothetical protein